MRWIPNRSRKVSLYTMICLSFPEKRRSLSSFAFTIFSPFARSFTDGRGIAEALAQCGAFKCHALSRNLFCQWLHLLAAQPGSGIRVVEKTALNNDIYNHTGTVKLLAKGEKIAVSSQPRTAFQARPPAPLVQGKILPLYRSIPHPPAKGDRLHLCSPSGYDPGKGRG